MRIVSEGVSEVVFSRREDAVAAVAKYNNVLLDGRAMILKLEGGAPITTVAGVSSARSAVTFSMLAFFVISRRFVVFLVPLAAFLTTGGLV